MNPQQFEASCIGIYYSMSCEGEMFFNTTARNTQREEDMVVRLRQPTSITAFTYID